MLRNQIGVMQGRLLPKYQGRYQAHPVGYWEQEFDLAQGIGLDCIEFILDFNDAKNNPLLEKGGVDNILSVTDKTGVSVKTVCADYFMEAPLHSQDSLCVENSIDVLVKLLETSSALGVSDIVIPCVDQATLKTEGALERFVDNVSSISNIIEEKKINLALETDLPPRAFSMLLERLSSRYFTVNYDTGNSAALGFDLNDELSAYGERITDIHIKDRVLGGESVLLGSGSTDFGRFFRKLKTLDYQGPLIMQAYRDDEGLVVFKKQLDWFKSYVD
jgi:L-ribulose-5-phosphate 3-epimerase